MQNTDLFTIKVYILACLQEERQGKNTYLQTHPSKLDGQKKLDSHKSQKLSTQHINTRTHAILSISFCEQIYSATFFFVSECLQEN